LAGLEKNRDNDNDISNKDSINGNDISDNDSINDSEISDNDTINDNDISDNEIDIDNDINCGYSNNISWAGKKRTQYYLSAIGLRLIDYDI